MIVHFYLFFRWPAVITKDPLSEDAKHIIRYEDGTNDPKYYHVEFLGDIHTHAWVLAKFVQVYNTSTGILVFDEKSMKKKKLKDDFKKSNLKALKFINLSPEERTEACTFQWSEDNFEPPKYNKFDKILFLISIHFAYYTKRMFVLSGYLKKQNNLI